MIVAYILLGQSAKQVKSLKRQNFQLLSHIASLTTGKTLETIKEEQSLYRRDFISHKDSLPDSYVLSPPLIPPDDGKYTLVVYLHGMGANYLEPYYVPKKEPIVPRIQEAFPSLIVASLSYGKQSAWMSEKAIADIDQNIAELTYAYPIHDIVLMGTSMGGCTALYYSTAAPDAIKKRIKGVVSVEGAGDLKTLFSATKATLVKFGIANALGGTPEQVPQVYERTSFLNHIDKLPVTTRFAIVSAKRDSTVPPGLQVDVKEALEKHGNPTRFLTVESGHELPPPEVYVDGLRYVLGNEK